MINPIKFMIDRIATEYNLELSWSVDDHVFVCSNKDLYIQFIKPHDGNDRKYCLRADFPETFDRWGVCLYEDIFEESEFENTLKSLDEFVKSKDSLVTNNV